MDPDSHPHPDYEWGCPDCRSTDIGQVHEVPGTRTQVPRYQCHDCGIRFWESVEVRVTDEGD